VGKRVPTIGLPIVVSVAAITTSFYTVASEGEALVKRFGTVVAQQPPGLHWEFPFWIDRTYFVSTQMVLKEEFGFRTLRADQQTTYDQQDYPDESLMLTGDLNVIDVDWVVQYHIRDPNRFGHRIRYPEEPIRDVERRKSSNRLRRSPIQQLCNQFLKPYIQPRVGQ